MTWGVHKSPSDQDAFIQKGPPAFKKQGGLFVIVPAIIKPGRNPDLHVLLDLGESGTLPRPGALHLKSAAACAFRTGNTGMQVGLIAEKVVVIPAFGFRAQGVSLLPAFGTGEDATP